MKQDGDYILFGPEEVKSLGDRIEGDAYRYGSDGIWSPCGTHELYQRQAGYQNQGYTIRRHMIHCTPEQLAAARVTPLNEHFM